MTFGVTPVAGFPPPTPDAFPGGLQWQLDGADVGDRTIDTVSFVSGDTLAMEVDEDNSARLIITIPAGGGGSTVSNLILSLVPTDDPMAFDGVDYTDWTATVAQTSVDAEWDPDAQNIKFNTAGFYRVAMTVKIAPDTGAWPTDQDDGSTVTKYGSAVTEAIGNRDRSLHERSASFGPEQESSPGSTQWTDEYIVQASVDEVTTPVVYAAHYNGQAMGATFTATVVVTKL